MKRGIVRLAVCALAVLAAGCGAVLVEPQMVLPRALVEQAPATVGVHYPGEFRNYVYKETRYGTDYEVNLGPAHVAELNRLFGAMFAKLVELEDPQQPDSSSSRPTALFRPHSRRQYQHLTSRLRFHLPEIRRRPPIHPNPSRRPQSRPLLRAVLTKRSWTVSAWRCSVRS